MVLTRVINRRLPGRGHEKAPQSQGFRQCAEEDSNLHGTYIPQGPQPCASTNSATGAGGTAGTVEPPAGAEYSSGSASVLDRRAALSGPPAAARTTTAATSPPAPRSAIARPADADSVMAPASALPAAAPTAMPVDVQVNASVRVPGG